MSYRPTSGQGQGIPIVSSAVVQPPLSQSIIPGSFPSAPQLLTRHAATLSYGNHIQDDGRRGVTPSSYPRLHQRLHHPIISTSQTLIPQRHQNELQHNLQESIVKQDPPLFMRPSSVIGRSPVVVPSLQSNVGFSQNQLAVLRQQILVFRRLKKQDYDIDQDVLDSTKPLPFPTREGKSSEDWPLCRLDRAAEPIMPLKVNVTSILKREYSSRLAKFRSEEIYKIERALKGPTKPGFPRKGEKNISGIPYRGELMLRLRKLRLMMEQKKMRRTVEDIQAQIMSYSDRAYRKFVREASRYKFDLFKNGEKAKSDKAQERAQSAKRMKMSIFDKASTSKDYRTVHNRHVLRIHERQARYHNKQKDDDQVRRMEALKANDFEAYQELLLQQKQSAAGPSTNGDRYEEISRFLSDTEEYLNRLAAKVATVKISQEASEAAAKAISEARAQGASEEEVQLAAREAAQEVAATTELTKRSSNFGEDAQSRYYSLAHSVEEEITREPSYLRPPANAFLRQYQIVGLQWMVSLYNNRLNGILADEMGLGKTVQVMALIAYLMEHKGDFGPHLIIVPNAVIVNWKAEFTQWLPNLRVVYYVGQKDDRSKKFNQDVQAMKFNVLVTTYEFIMRDRSKLCRIQWHYMIIDEAQRMKDRQSKLSQDLNRFSVNRRLLLTGTPLQNDLQELWSLLNLLLPEVFDDKKSFTEWFGEALSNTAQDGQHKQDSLEWLETEKRVVVIHRLHQILEPFMLRRQVQDVERKLPNKIPVVLKVAMPPYQSRIYNWVKSTGTLRLDPYGPLIGQRRHEFAPLNNKVMELRKVCNHPLLSYPHQDYTLESLVRQCGKMSLLDRVLIKLYKAGHRVLLFSTMTKLLDLMEVYMKYRTMEDGRRFQYRRIDGGTSLEDREVAIRDFNQAGSEVFLFLLSIRAAGRGLNLQTADTVIIFDPDANPKNEEQAVARAYRIGQMKDVLVIYLETVADPLHYETPLDHEEGAKLYVDSIESLVRKTIQKQKIEMANEVIDAGRFDMNTTNEQRKQTLENMLADEERFKVATNQVPDLKEINQMIARSEEERQLFDSLDETIDWPYDPYTECPDWMLFDDDDILSALNTTSRHHVKKEMKRREEARYRRQREMELEESTSAMDLDWKDMSSSINPEQTERTDNWDDTDDLEEVIGAENYSLEGSDSKEELSRSFVASTGVQVPQRRRSSARRRRSDLNPLYNARFLKKSNKQFKPIKIRITGLK